LNTFLTCAICTYISVCLPVLLFLGPSPYSATLLVHDDWPDPSDLSIADFSELASDTKYELNKCFKNK
jgi:hypothetical protein